MKPLFIISMHLGLGGIEKKIIDMVNYLDDYRPNLPIYILLKRHTRFDRAIKIKNKKVKIINYQDWHRFKIPFFFPIFVLIKTWQLKPRAILAFLDLCSWSAVLAKLVFFWRKIVVVLSEDHYTSKIVASYNYSKLRFYLIRWLYPKADRVVSCTRVTKQDLIINCNLPFKKIEVIKNWTFLVEKNLIKKINKKYDFIYMGRLAKTKKLQWLLEGLVRIKRKKPNIKLALLGKGEDFELLKKLVIKWKLKNNVIFLGVHFDIEKYLGQSKILIHCSKKKVEGFPISILEAMALNVPVLSVNFKGASEVIESGENGLLFDSLNEFVKKAVKLLNQPELRCILKKKARNYIKQYHGPDNMCDYFKLLQL